MVQRAPETTLHYLTQLALDLKAAGFPQSLDYRDGVWFPDSGEYGSPREVEEGRAFVRVPNTTMLFSMVEDLDYTLECCSLLKGGAFVRGYRLRAKNLEPIEDLSLGWVMGRFWLATKGAPANVR